MSELDTELNAELDAELDAESAAGGVAGIAAVIDDEPAAGARQRSRNAAAPTELEPENRGAASAPATKSEHHLVIRPTGGWRALDLRELWRRRELTYFFVWRDLKVRYKQTALGAVWAFIQPLLTTGVFAVLFGLLMGRTRTPTVPGTPYFVCTFCAMLPWGLFAFALQHSGNSLVHNHRMVQKIYFPRLVIPISAVFSGLADFAVGFVALLVMMAVGDVSFTWRIAAAPLFIMLALGASIGAGLWLSALNATYRDFRFIIPFLVQFGMFVSPVVYATSSIENKLPTWLAKLYWLNPMAGAIEGFRWSMLEKAPPPGLMIIPSILMTIVLLVTGMFYFRRMERTFADVIQGRERGRAGGQAALDRRNRDPTESFHIDMSSDVVIDAQQVGKRYRLGERHGRSYRTLRESLQHLATAPIRRMRRSSSKVKKAKQPGAKAHALEPDLWALRDVDFQVRRGDVLGIIGQNGAGKSTLLKILSRITEPTTGQIEMNGRVSSLLEVGTGFHPELTGRENVFMNGSILGMTRAEIKRKFDQIVEFSGVERFLDTPVKRYSSGMSVRLAFAVAAHLEPEILVIDEVLAVGDFEFQNRCLGKMNDVARSGRTILFVSHNMAAVENLCTRAILFEHGQIKKDGAVDDVISLYHRSGAGVGHDSTDLTLHPGRRGGLSPVATSLRMLASDGEVVNALPVGGDCTFELVLESKTPLPNVVIVLRVLTAYGERVCTFHTKHQHAGGLAVKHRSVATCTFKNCRLYPGDYSLLVQVKSNRTVVDEIDGALKFAVTQRDAYGTGRAVARRGGYYLPEAEWEFGETASAAGETRTPLATLTTSD